MEFAIAKVSTKGQIVIPSALRKDISEGDEFLFVKDGNKILLKKIKEIASGLKGDLLFAEKVEKSWKEYDQGKFEKDSEEDFLAKLRSC